MGLTQRDIALQLVSLTVADFYRCEEARFGGAEPIWVFAPWDLAENRLWIRLRRQDGILLISFHPWDRHE